MPESNTRRSKTFPGGSFRRLARRSLKPGTRKPSVVLELWRAGAPRRPQRLPVSSRRIAEAVKTTLANEKFSLSGGFCFVFVGKRFLKKLNQDFRRVGRETDVISFSYMKGIKFFPSPQPSPSSGEGVALADIYISEDNAAENAARFGESLKNEFLRLVIHGTLHALGYTDYTPRAKKRMWARQERALLQSIR